MSKAKGQKLRLHKVSQLGVHWPRLARLLIQDMTADCIQNGRCFSSFAVPELPLSLNHQFENATRWGKDKKSGKTKRFMGKKLKDEVHEFRQMVKEAMFHSKTQWRATGVTGAVILFESPVWITAEHRARIVDADNKVKPLMDAVQKATNVPDELHWQLHIFKVASTRERTLVYLFDLGDVVDYFS